MFSHLPLECEILLPPHYIGAQLVRLVKKKLHAQVEGTCSARHGFVIAVDVIEKIGLGTIDIRRGLVVYPVKYSAIVFRPHIGEILEADVTHVDAFGLFAQIGPLFCFISRHRMPMDVQFCPNHICYWTKDVTIAAADRIRVQIVETRQEAAGIFAIATLIY